MPYAKSGHSNNLPSDTTTAACKNEDAQTQAIRYIINCLEDPAKIEMDHKGIEWVSRRAKNISLSPQGHRTQVFEKNKTYLT